MRFTFSQTALILIAISFCAHSAYGTIIHDKEPKNKAKNKQQTLPPGLQKKRHRGDPLPLGWQKKLKPGERLSDDIFARAKAISPIDKQGNVVIDID